MSSGLFKNNVHLQTTHTHTWATETVLSPFYVTSRNGYCKRVMTPTAESKRF